MIEAAKGVGLIPTPRPSLEIMWYNNGDLIRVGLSLDAEKFSHISGLQRHFLPLALIILGRVEGLKNFYLLQAGRLNRYPGREYAS